MTPWQWAIRPLKLYATFSGRAPRAEYWWFALLILAISMIFWLFLVGSLMGASDGLTTLAAGGLGTTFVVLLLFGLAIFLPSLGVSIRRLHDIDHSGWWIGGCYLLSLLYGMWGAGARDGEVASMGSGIATVFLAVIVLVYAIVLLVFFCKRGTVGPNRFGPDPYGPDGIAPEAVEHAPID